MVRLLISMENSVLTVGGNELQVTYIGYVPEAIVSLKAGVKFLQHNHERRHQNLG